MVILIIEDDYVLRDNYAELFRESGYDVYTAENGKSGLRLIKKLLPDIVLCDILMPDIDGYEVRKQMLKDKKASTIPFIFLSAKSSAEDIKKGLKIGADDYITKPVKAKELLSIVENRLERLKVVTGSGQIKDNKMKQPDLKRLLITIKNQPVFIEIDDLLFISAEGYYSVIRTVDGLKELVKKPLKYWETVLPENDFVRIHRNTIINMKYIQRLENWTRSTYRVFMKNCDEPLCFSQRYSKLIRERFMIK